MVITNEKFLEDESHDSKAEEKIIAVHPDAERFNAIVQAYLDLEKRERINPKNPKSKPVIQAMLEIYKTMQTEMPGIPDIEYKISEEKQAMIDEIVEKAISLSPEEKYNASEKDFWFFQIRNIIDVTQKEFTDIYTEHGYPVNSNWAGSWERGAKDPELLPHKFFTLPTSIAGNPEAMLITARGTHMSLIDLLILSGYPLHAYRNMEIQLKQLLEEQADQLENLLEAQINESNKKLEEQAKEFNRTLEDKVEEAKQELESYYQSTIKTLESQRDLIYSYLNRFDTIESDKLLRLLDALKELD